MKTIQIKVSDSKFSFIKKLLNELGLNHTLIADKKPNMETLKAMEDAKNSKTKKYSSVKDLINDLTD